LNIPREDVSVTIVNRDRWHAIRVRNYETDLAGLRVPLDEVLDPIGVEIVVADVVGDRLRAPPGLLRAIRADRRADL
jgi:NADH dehydrogenase